ncbi:unnamed protein product [Meganyctiphanes norvegica]|uniref:Reverse transcriptase domain-containing protein n=1 Tax=Meganyctiphanes norvegica TaxID=48144 RepID=A0AAV2QBX4_MEGNR
MSFLVQKSKYSCLSFADIDDVLNKHKPIGTMYFDCKKAYHTIPHKRLIGTLKAYGISGKVLEWIKSYLGNRTQQSYVNGVLSKSLPCPSGFPLDSVIGPVLFMIYINNLLEGVQPDGKLSLSDEDFKLFKCWFQ